MHKAKKHFGQNFLVDEQIIADIIAAIRPAAEDNMVEIGPGLGALTRPLLVRLNRLHVVEIDRDIIARLKHDYPQDNPAAKLTIHAGDALKFDFATLPAPLRIVGNLPYNISSPLLFHFAGYAGCIRDMHFMLQNEVVERMVAAPSTPEYGRLSVMLQYRFHMEKLLDVPPHSFRPAPKVDSAVVRMIPLLAAEIGVRNEKLFAAIVGAAFGQRRKTLRNTLRGYLDEADFAQMGIDAMLRAENLSVAEFALVTEYLDKAEHRR
ncbi:MAG: 16S rRNA (adenine(1518)-N(6)/adenine(1519)-N(6))-dimethyltransferase [Gallionellales bacterium RIFCSPLOWO2_12_FULL_59_22]|nr:MAG: 16S rRNA (adenine(1518)-N(6)/adenine(1519)-N(6))-dimethyltransferase [Gallionellales bacterium RIFCSPLOWO2_02_FULL_59_110]OGT04261.1 MAG: 16S rRNA (adenine(1518)-N(6)/adenine(1519)-N(6))-dimethyltransferase [Gallionellales bacterium RIFCSPLOWO2_02_58_13]OGT13295.1 MAG: 16S rRNA (adenine(1518)-N(6)/adenine(1519)-N(6))-dimethyltransferase [Gallionellales bacterium RIFCSPLOWO2_12_FULL_59_22]